MFKQTAVFYITKSNIFFVSKNIVLKILDLKTLIVNQEVVNMDAFVKSLSSFIVSLKVKNTKTLILIDESLTYEKEIQDKDITQQTLDQFSQELPFDPKELEITNIKTGTKSILVATNKLLYQALVKSLRQNGNEVQFVIPAKYVYLHEIDLHTLSFDKLLSKITATTKIEAINFKQEEIDFPQSVQSEKISTTNQQESAQSKAEKNKGDLQQSTPNKHPILFKYLSFALVGLIAIAVLVYIAIKSLTR